MGSHQSGRNSTAQISEMSLEIRFLCWRHHRNMLKSHPIIAADEVCRGRGAAGSTYNKCSVNHSVLLGIHAASCSTSFLRHSPTSQTMDLSCPVLFSFIFPSRSFCHSKLWYDNSWDISKGVIVPKQRLWIKNKKQENWKISKYERLVKYSRVSVFAGLFTFTTFFLVEKSSLCPPNWSLA